MHRVPLLLCLIVAAIACTPAAAADSATSGPNAESTPLGLTAGPAAGAAPTGTAAADCPARPKLAEGAPSGVIVELDPDTLWRPRGAEVRFTIRGAGGPVGVAQVRVCFGWGSPDGEFRRSQTLMGSPAVRSITNDSGAVEYGAVVPRLPKVPEVDWWPRRIFAQTPYIYTGAFSVPVADMVVEVTTTGGTKVVTATQVGVTSVIIVWAVVVAVSVLVWFIIDAITHYRGISGRNLLLRVIATRDGYASLSQLQVVLWTIVVAMSAIYVMTLSGNLISISDGTLVLLGIAGGTALAARIPVSGGNPPAPVAPGPVGVRPEWSDLVVANRTTQAIDVTRLQMLTFTLITAAFVLVKVVVDYEIPAIPANFLVLMGISNGVYVGGRNLPSQPKGGGTATDS